MSYHLKLCRVEDNAVSEMNHAAQHVAGARYCENMESVHGRKKQDWSVQCGRENEHRRNKVGALDGPFSMNKKLQNHWPGNISFIEKGPTRSVAIFVQPYFPKQSLVLFFLRYRSKEMARTDRKVNVDIVSESQCLRIDTVAG